MSEGSLMGFMAGGCMERRRLGKMITMRETGKTNQAGNGKLVLAAGLVLLAGVGLAGGCTEKPGYYPNRDPALRRPVVSLRADAAGRIYPSEATRVRGLAARSQIGYMAKTVDVVNLSGEDFENVEVWVNGRYVCFLPVIERGVLKSIPYDAMFDREGNAIPKESRTFVVETVELYMGGKLYDLVTQIAY